MSYLRSYFAAFLVAGASLFAAQAGEEEIDFAHDVLQHHGAPLLSFYHRVRENTFLNTELEESSFLERCGDFFLAPGRYLFGGKTLRLKADGELEIRQSFSYESGYAWKAPAAFILLPICEPIGLALKGMAQIASDGEEHHLKVRAIRQIPASLRDRDISMLHSENELAHQNYPRPDKLSERQYTDLAALEQILTRLEAYNIPCWLDFGTCLGSYRHGGMIPWDYDIDVAVLASDHQAVKRILATLDPQLYQIQDWSSYKRPETFLRLYVKATRNFIDIYHYAVDEKSGLVTYIFSAEDSPFPESWKRTERFAAKHPLRYDQMFPLKKAKFDHLTAWVPNDTIAYLEGRYGPNLEPSMVWNIESQSYAKVVDHPYWKIKEGSS